jgi:hypothetical protein
VATAVVDRIRVLNSSTRSTTWRRDRSTALAVLDDQTWRRPGTMLGPNPRSSHRGRRPGEVGGERAQRLDGVIDLRDRPP